MTSARAIHTLYMPFDFELIFYNIPPTDDVLACNNNKKYPMPLLCDFGC